MIAVTERKGRHSRECGCSVASRHVGGVVAGTDCADEAASMGEGRSGRRFDDVFNVVSDV